MLSVFLRAGNHPAGGPAHHHMSGNASGRQGDIGPMAVPAEPVADAPADAAVGNLPGLLSAIIANAEFLEVVYGENRHLKNILDAAGEAKRQFRDRLQ